MKDKTVQKNMRLYHRYLGFFLAGIMAVYALSGILMIFRDTDFLKKEMIQERTLAEGTKIEDLGKELRMRDFKITKVEQEMVYFESGNYNTNTRLVTYKVKELPFVLKKMTDMHKATSEKPLFFLNVFFGLSLLFFVISSFWMFLPKTSIFKKGMYFAIAGLFLTILLIFI